MMIDKETSMDYTYTTMIDVIKRIAEDDSPRHIRRQLNRLTTDERRKVRQLMDYVEMEITDIEDIERYGIGRYTELLGEAS
jgi:Mg/Co/Ni transporter MgtE